MLREDPDHRASNYGAFIEVGGRNAFNRFTQAQELSLTLGRQRASVAIELVHSRAADLTLDRLGVAGQHRKCKGHALSVIATHFSLRKRHRKSPSPSLVKMRRFVVYVEGLA
jgi:hypothetical protein